MTREQILRDFTDNRICPCCEAHDRFLSGPRGGACVNVMCEACGSRFNVLAGFGQVVAIDFTHGPQPHIWGGARPTRTPDPERVREVEAALRRL